MSSATQFRAVDARSLVPGVPAGLAGLLVKDSPARQPIARLIAVGDTLPATNGFVGRRQEPTLASRSVCETLQSSDVVFANLEAVLSDEPLEQCHFSVPTESARSLVGAGISLVNLANNHTIDAGPLGLESTALTLNGQGITTLGASGEGCRAEAATRTDANGLSIGWLAAARTGLDPPAGGWWVHELNPDSILLQVRKARSEVDCLIVSLHTGYMFVEFPHPDTRRLAQRLAAEGADLILMHHPHVLQGVEVLEGGAVVCYSLGNFRFDWRAGIIPTAADEGMQREGALFCFELDRQGVVSAVLLPTWTGDDLEVDWLNPERAGDVAARVTRLSQELMKPDWEKLFWRQRADRNTLHGIKMLWYLLRRGRLIHLGRQLGKLRFHHLTMFSSWMIQRFRAADDQTP